MAKHTFDNVEINVNYSESKDRVNIESGENLPILFGKIRKYFTDLKSMAFKESITKEDVESAMGLSPIGVSVKNISIPSDSWVLGEDGKYKYSIQLDSIGLNSKIDIDCDYDTFVSIPDLIIPYNDNGSIGVITSKKPNNDITIQISVSENNKIL